MSGAATLAAEVAHEPPRRPARIGPVLDRLAPLLGLVWFAAGLVLESVPGYAAFAGFAPGPALTSFAELLTSGEAWRAAAPSLLRIAQGLAAAFGLGATIPHLTRSSLHRCLQRDSIRRLPEVDGDKPKRSRFKAYPLGYFHIDLAKVHTAEGRLYLLVAIDRTTEFAFVELHEKATRRVAGDFLRHLIKAVPYKVHTVLTDKGTHFTTPGNVASSASIIRQAIAVGETFGAHSFELACARNDIDRRLTKPRHPWTNGQVERMNRTIKDATVKRDHYNSHERLRAHLADFAGAHNFGRRLKTLRGLTPYEAICAAWSAEPSRFRSNPLHQIPGPNI